MISSQDIVDIKHSLAIQNKIKILSLQDKELGFDLPIRDFIIVMQMLTAQSYGSRIQNRFIKELGLQKISSNKNTGDCKDNFGDFYEVKCSIITITNPRLNFVQIRLWQNINGYFGIAIDTRIDPMDITTYRLNKSQMIEECRLMKASSAHGTKEANLNNQNKELRFDLVIDKNNQHYIRWENYKSNFKF